jgi:6-pyruvoyltetrahydropterin/6-carboxytetrahydropterin synthase
MPIGYLTRVVEFTATHRFPETPEFAGATNDHSHHYKCAVTVRGFFDPTQGGIMSLPTLKTLLQREVVARFEGRHINKDIAAFAVGGAGTWVATGEALALYVWERIVDQLPNGVTLHSVRIEESDHLYSEYRGET